MSHPPTGGIAPTTAPERPTPSPTRPTPPTPTPPAEPAARRPAWREGLDTLRAAAVTEPGRLRAIGAVLAALVVLFGALAAWQVDARTDAARAVTGRSQPLSSDAAEIYRSLAAADATAASAFLVEGPEPPALREDFDRDLAHASKLLVKAAASSGGSGAARAQIDRLVRDLPRYAGLVESARANNRQGLPLGGAYLRHANALMSAELLPAADALYRTQSDQLTADYADARAWPWVAFGAGALALAALAWAQHRTYRRTNRVFNLGLLAATAATAVALVWLAVGHAVVRSGLGESDRHGARSLRVLGEARIAVLQARGNENLVLVARGAVVRESPPEKGQDAYEVGYDERMRALLGTAPASDAPDAEAGGLLGRAQRLADDASGRGPVGEAIRAAREWQHRHEGARQANEEGAYDAALEMVTGARGSTGESFEQVDAALTRAIAHEQREFERAADDGRGLVAELPVGAGVLALVGAVSTVLGVGRRLSEYR
ncbi:hypothetical protein [Streptomyces youssoufiensis]